MTTIFSLHPERIDCNDKSLSRAEQPVLFRLIQLLAEQTQPRHSSWLYRQIFREEYTTAVHRSRMNSLLERAREFLGNESIKREEGWVEMAESLRGQVNSKKELREERLSAVETFLRKSGDAVTVSRVAEELAFSRRTLQQDLQRLVTQGRARKIGEARQIRYVAI